MRNKTKQILVGILAGVLALGQTAFAAEEVYSGFTEAPYQETTMEEQQTTEAVTEPYAEETPVVQEFVSESEWIGEEPETWAEPETESETEPKTEAEQPQASDGTEEAAPQVTNPYWTELPDILVTGLDFSSGRIVVGTDDASIFVDEGVILSSYNGLYLLQFEDEHTARQAYLYYYDKADLVDIDNGIRIADGEAEDERVQTETVMTAEENPFTELSTALETEQAQKQEAEDAGIPYEEPAYDIALIDTGVSEESGIDRMTLIGGDGVDDNGHGTKMAETILAQNPDAKILSIKALDGEGKGDITAVYAAVQYAIEHNIPVINLSMSARASQKNSILEEAIRKGITESEDEAKQKITVVGAAGNHGKNAKYYVPGKIEAALIVGVAAKDGTRLELSNYGETVDYNVVAESTSEAAAIASGFISLHGTDAVEETVGQGVFCLTEERLKPEESETEPKSETEPTEPDSESEEKAESETEEGSDDFEASAVTWSRNLMEMAYSGGSNISGIRRLNDPRDPVIPANEKIQVNEQMFDNIIPLFKSIIPEMTRINTTGTVPEVGYIYKAKSGSFKKVYCFPVKKNGLTTYGNSGPKIRYYVGTKTNIRLNILVSVQATYSNKGSDWANDDYAYFDPEACLIGFGETIYGSQNLNNVKHPAYGVLYRLQNGCKDYVGFHVDVFEGTSSTDKLDDYPIVYSGITDIDEGQSIRRLNNNPILATNSIIRNASAFDKDDNNSGLRSRFVYNETNVNLNYFYSETNVNNPSAPTFSSPNQANVYSRVRMDAADNSKSLIATDGLDYVFGWAKTAASTIELFVPAGELDITKNVDTTTNTATLTIDKMKIAEDLNKYQYAVTLSNYPAGRTHQVQRYYTNGTTYDDSPLTLDPTGQHKITLNPSVNIDEAKITNLVAGTRYEIVEYQGEGANATLTGRTATGTIKGPDLDKAFAFRVTVKNGSETVPAGLNVRAVDTTTNLQWVMTTNENGVLERGNGTLLPVKPGHTVQLRGIPLGYTCTVAEVQKAGFQDTSSTVATRTPETPSATNGSLTDMAKVKWTNRYVPEDKTVTFKSAVNMLTVKVDPYDYYQYQGYVDIKKTVNGRSADTNKEFSFRLDEIEAAEGQSLEYNIAIPRADGTGSDWQWASWHAIPANRTIELKHNQAARIRHVNPGSQYMITEVEDPTYTQNQTSRTGTIPEIVTEGKQSQRFIFRVDVNSVKVVNGTVDPNQVGNVPSDFKITNIKGNTPTGITKHGGGSSQFYFTFEGYGGFDYTFLVPSVATEVYRYNITITPKGYTSPTNTGGWTNLSSGTTIEWQDSEGGKWRNTKSTRATSFFTNDEDPSEWAFTYEPPKNKATFRNSTKTGSFSVTKEMTEFEKDTGKSFTFSLGLKSGSTGITGNFPYSVNGADQGTVRFTNGEGSIQLEAGETAIIEDIPNPGDVTFTATEVADTAFTFTKTGGNNDPIGWNVLHGTNWIETLESGNGLWADGTWGRNNADTSGAYREPTTTSSFPFTPYKDGTKTKGIHLVKTDAAATGINVTQRLVPVEQGKTYVLSWWAVGTGTLNSFAGYNPNYQTKSQTITASEWRKYTMEIRPGENGCGLTEENNLNIAFGIPANQTGDITIADMRLEEKAEAVFTNMRTTGSVVVSKTVQGTTDQTQTFTFDLTLQRSGGNLSGTYPYTVNGEKRDSGTIQFTDGHASLTLRGGETAIIENIPYDNAVEFNATELSNAAYNTTESRIGSGNKLGPNLLRGTTRIRLTNDAAESADGAWYQDYPNNEDTPQNAVSLADVRSGSDRFLFAPYNAEDAHASGIRLKKVAGADPMRVRQTGVSVTSGTTYLMSCWAKSTNGNGNLALFAGYNNNNNNGPVTYKSQLQTVGSQWKKYVMEFKAGTDCDIKAEDGTINVVYGITQENAGDILITDLRLEEKKGKAFINTLKTGELVLNPTVGNGTVKIKKTVQDNGNPNQEFEFQATTLTQNGTYTKHDANGTQIGSVTSIARGQKFTLKDGQYILLHLPAGTNYTFEEINIPTGYGRVNPNGAFSGSIPTLNRITFTVEFRSGGTNVENVVIPYSVQGGTTGTYTTNNITVPVMPGSPVTLTVPSGYTYTVTPPTITQWNNVPNATGTITSGGSANPTLTFTPTTTEHEQINKCTQTVDADIYATKELDAGGRILQNQEFTFGLYDNADCLGNPLDTAKNNTSTSSNVRFTVTLSSADVGTPKNYWIKEILPSTREEGMRYDTTARKVTVTVSRNGANLTATTKYGPSGDSTTVPTITNRYTASGTADIKAKKILNGRALRNGEFSFGLYDNATCSGEPIATETNTTASGDSNITFQVTYNQSNIGQTYYYYIKEIIPNTQEPGMRYATNIRKVRVGPITDLGNGRLNAPVVYGNDQNAITYDGTTRTFTNRYIASHNLTVQKTVTGNMGNKAQDFHFGITLTNNDVEINLGDTNVVNMTYVKRYKGTTENGSVTVDARDNCVFTPATGSGTTEFALSHGDQLIISGIPEGTKYKVTETEANDQGYTTTWQNNSNNETPLNADTTVTCTNRRNQLVPTKVRVPLYGGLGLALGGVVFLTQWIIRRRKRDGGSEE